MLAQVSGAAMRGLLVALMVATPSLLLPSNTTNVPEVVALLALLTGMLTFIEYNSNYPSLLEFRDAPPLNRKRFAALFATVFLLSVMTKHMYEPTTMTELVSRLGVFAGAAADFPISPIRNMVLMLSPDVTQAQALAVRDAAALAYLVSVLAILSFWVQVRFYAWPNNVGAFNVWVNLPLFDPTSGGDVVGRLQRDGRVNVLLGLLVPFVLPALLKSAEPLTGPITLSNPHTLIWAVAGWAMLPASMAMRGIAMLRIAELIEEKRRRAYANAEAIQPA